MLCDKSSSFGSQFIAREESPPRPPSSREGLLGKPSVRVATQPSAMQTPEKPSPRRHAESLHTKASLCDDAAGQMKILKFLDASVPMPPLGVCGKLDSQCLSQEELQPAQVAPYVPAGSRPGFSPRCSAVSNHHEADVFLVLKRFTESMTEEMQKLAVDLSSRLDMAERRWSQSLRSERLDRESQLQDIGNALRKTLPDLCACKDKLDAQAQVSPSGRTFQETEFSSMIEELRNICTEDRSRSQCQSSGFPVAVHPDSLLQALEGILQPILDAQMEQLTQTISGSLETRLAELVTRIQTVEEKCIEEVKNERMERSAALVAVSAALKEYETLTSKAGAIHEDLSDIVKKLSHDQDRKFSALRLEVDATLTSVATHREEMTAMVLSESAEVRGSLDQHRRHGCRLQEEFEKFREQFKPQDILEQVTLQLTGMDLVDRQKSQQATINSVQKHVDELREIWSQFLHQVHDDVQQPETTPQASSPHIESAAASIQASLFDRSGLQREKKDGALEEMRDYVSELAKSCNDLKETSWKEAEDLRSFLLQEVQMVRDDLGTLQSSVVGLLVCTKNFKEWKDSHSDHVRRLERELIATLCANRKTFKEFAAPS